MYLEYELTPEEYKDFNYYTVWSSPEKRSARIKYYLRNLGLYLASFTIVLLVISKKSFTITGIIFLSVFAILLLFYLKSTIRRQVDRNVDQLVKESGEDRIFSHCELNITEKGLFEKSRDSETNYQWSAVLKRVEAYNCYYLYINSRFAIVIPKRVFSSVREKEEFDKMLLQHLPLSADLPIVTAK